MTAIGDAADEHLASLTHLPNRTPCPLCRDGVLPSIGPDVAALLGLEDRARPCPACKGTGARNCDLGCGELAVAFDLEAYRFVCARCLEL